MPKVALVVEATSTSAEQQKPVRKKDKKWNNSETTSQRSCSLVQDLFVDH
jgi:hypothetical protein